MGKIFTIEFQYQNTDQYAMVNVEIHEKVPWFHIQLHDKELDKIILTNHLRYAGVEGYKNIEAYRYESGKELLDCLGSEVKMHITVKPSYIKC